MFGRRLRLPRTLLAALVLTGCARAASTGSAPPAVSTQPRGPRLDAPFAPDGGARLFHTAMDESFWLEHSAERDRVVSAGVRLELDPKSGVVLASAWDLDLARKSDPLLGALAVAPHLGGGFVFWSRNRVFRADSFTGPLRAVLARGALGTVAGVRGARNGLEAVIVFGEGGAGALKRGSDVLEPPPEAALVDLAALGKDRALRVDATGRLASTTNGGAAWRDEAAKAGFSSKTLLVEPSALAVETWQGRLPFGPDGALGPIDGEQHASSHGRGFEPILPGARVDDRSPWWIFREVPPMQAAVIGGARIDASHALALVPTAAGIVDLERGELSRATSDWPQPGLLCSSVAGPDEPLIVCGWEAYQGYGAYVLRLRGGALPPVVEKAFSDDGYFVTDDAGALGFVGSCKLEARLVDPNDASRMEPMGEVRPASRICVRRGPGDWVEHEIEVPEGTDLQGWAARRDGSAVAIVVRQAESGLPEALGEVAPVEVQGAVRVVRVPADVGGFTAVRPAWNPYGMYLGSGRGPQGPFVERRYRARDDGGLDAWFVAGGGVDSTSGVQAGVLVDAKGRATVFPPPPRVVSMIATGDYGVAAARDGELFETLDHGRTYRPAGRSPVPPVSFGGFCSPLGCVIGPVTRLGWGSPKTNPTIHPDELPDEPTSPSISPVRLACTPAGKPEVVEESEPSSERRNGRFTWQTGYGDTVTLVREVEAEHDGDEGAGPFGNLPPEVMQMLPPEVLAKLNLPVPLPKADAPSAAAKPKPKPRGVPLRTHSMLFRAPFDPDAVPLRIDATGSDLEEARRQTITPLLGADGEVGLLFVTDKHEVLLAGEKTTTLPLFEPRRYASGDGVVASGLLLGEGRALVVGEVRRRAALEDHGPLPARVPLLFGQEREGSARRGSALARREDGAVGLIFWDGSPPTAASVSALDPAARVFLPKAPLAPWSSATMGDDPGCKKATGYRALVPIDPAAWLALDERVLPGVRLGSAGALLVRWGSERVCVEAIDVAAERVPDEGTRDEGNLVARFEPAKGKRKGGTMRAGGLRQALVCRLEPASKELPR